MGLGYVGLGDNPNEVIVRFASTLPDDKYQIRIQATGPNAIVGNPGDTLSPDTGKDYKAFGFELDLRAQVQAVVPQPVIRSQVFTVCISSSLVNGDTLTVKNGPYTAILEFNTAPGNVLPGHVYVNRLGGDTAVATAIAAAINGLGQPASVAASASSAGQIVTITGSVFEPTVTTGNPVLNVIGATAITDGDKLTLSLAGTTLNFEFNDTDVNTTSTLGYTKIDFASSTATTTSINNAIVTAINNVLNNPTLAIQAAAVGTSIVFTGTTGTPVVSVNAASDRAFTQDSPHRRSPNQS